VHSTSIVKKSSDQLIIDGKRVFKASNVRKRKIHPVYLELAENLTHVDRLQFIKIYNGRLSNLLSKNKKKEPIIETGKAGIIGVELLIDTEYRTVQFYSITSSQKGYGRKMVAAVVAATPDGLDSCRFDGLEWWFLG